MTRMRPPFALSSSARETSSSSEEQSIKLSANGAPHSFHSSPSSRTESKPAAGFENLAVPLGRAPAEFAHSAERGASAQAEALRRRARVAYRGAHRCGVCVVGLVDDPYAAGSAAAEAAPAELRHSGEAARRLLRAHAAALRRGEGEAHVVRRAVRRRAARKALFPAQPRGSGRRSQGRLRSRSRGILQSKSQRPLRARRRFL